jgi:hypothetical protein
MADDVGLIAAGVAVVVAIVVAAGRGAGETVIRPVGGDGADPDGPLDVGTGVPDGPNDPDRGEWSYEDPADRPGSDDFDYDFGGDLLDDGSVWVGEGDGSVAGATPDPSTQPWRS